MIFDNVKGMSDRTLIVGCDSTQSDGTVRAGLMPSHLLPRAEDSISPIALTVAQHSPDCHGPKPLSSNEAQGWRRICNEEIRKKTLTIIDNLSVVGVWVKAIVLRYRIYALVMGFHVMCLTLGSGQSPTIEVGVGERFELESSVELIISFKESSKINLDQEINLTKEQRGMIVFSKLQSEAERSQSTIRKFLIEQGYPFKAFCISNCIWVVADQKLFDQLATDSSIQEIELNHSLQMQKLEEGSSPLQRSIEDSIPWGLKLVNVDQVWKMGYQGQGTVVGGHDTGVDWDHPALINTYRGWDGEANHNYHWHDAVHSISPLHEDSIITDLTNPCGLNIKTPCDDVASSHGTHTMGTMVGRDPSTNLTIGMAPAAKWIAVRNMERGFGTVASYLEGLEWFLAPTDLNNQNPNPSLAPHVINNSWSCPEKEGCNTTNFTLLETAIDNLRLAGIVVVASAGNQGRNGCLSIDRPPAFYRGTLTVGSVDRNDSLSSFSSRGPVMDSFNNETYIKPNVTAPGRGVLSSAKAGTYRELSGTSMAGPHVAGLVAVIISANPELAGQVETIEGIIEQSTEPKFEVDSCSAFPEELPNALHGFGRINALAAIKLALQTSPTSESSDRALDIYPNPATDLLFIDFDDREFRSKELTIYSMDGVFQKKHFIDKKNKTVVIQIGELSAGAYCLRIGKNWKKFIVQK